MTLTLCFVMMLVLLALGVPFFVALGLGTVALLLSTGALPLSLVGEALFEGVDSFALIAIPLFVLTGDVMVRSRLAYKLLDFAEATTGSLRSGFGTSTALGCGFFACISGSDAADAAAIGRITMARLVERGYPKPYACALVAAGACTGILIPPSIAYIIIGLVLGISSTTLFVAAIVPGVLVLVGVLVTNAVVNRLADFENSREPFSWRRWFAAANEAKWALSVPLIILGGIYSGVFTATEAAAVAVIYILLVDRFVYRQIGWKDLPEVFYQSGRTIGVIGMMIAMSAVFAWVLQTQGMARLLDTMLHAVSGGNTVLILLVMQFIIFLSGMFLEPIAAMYLLVPLFKPTLMAIGMDMVQFGAALTVNLSLAHLTPPVGVGLFLAAQLGNVSFARAALWAIPFVLCEIVVVLLTTFVPEVAMTLPNLMN